MDPLATRAAITGATARKAALKMTSNRSAIEARVFEVLMTYSMVQRSIIAAAQRK
jgi:hypothetical protein